MSKYSDDYNQLQINEGLITGAHITKLAEFWQDSHFLTTDGKCGPTTLKSILSDEVVDVVSEADTNPTMQLWEAFDGPLEHLPRNRRDVYKIFGDPAN
jgi:hypothetical protein